MKPTLSEFSYGYALTEEIVRSFGPFAGAPEFPSLIAEGKVGWDLNLKCPARGSLFLQFKLADQMRRDTAVELSTYGLSLPLPFFRMHLHAKRQSNQHQLLVDLSTAGEKVLYAAPCFHAIEELNHYYAARAVLQNSIFFDPLAIGPLPDDDAHHVAFTRPGAKCYRCSQPTLVRSLLHRQGSNSELIAVRTGTVADVAAQALRSMHIALENKVKAVVVTANQDTSAGKELNVLDQARHMARFAFNAEFLIQV